MYHMLRNVYLLLFFLQFIAGTLYRWHRLGPHQNIKGKLFLSIVDNLPIVSIVFEVFLARYYCCLYISIVAVVFFRSHVT